MKPSIAGWTAILSSTPAFAVCLFFTLCAGSGAVAQSSAGECPDLGIGAQVADQGGAVEAA